MFNITQKSKNMNCGGIKICHLTFPWERQHRSSAALSAFCVLGGAAVRTRWPRGPGADHAVCRAGHLTSHLCRGRLAFTVGDGYILSYRRQRWAHLRFDILTRSCCSHNSTREWVKHKLGNVLFLRGTRGQMESKAGGILCRESGDITPYQGWWDKNLVDSMKNERVNKVIGMHRAAPDGSVF